MGWDVRSAVWATVVLLGCGGTGVEPDGGGEVDAGPRDGSLFDAGSSDDSGLDGGSAVDAGRDAGAPTADAGSFDAGGDVDAGSFDAGGDADGGLLDDMGTDAAPDAGPPCVVPTGYPTIADALTEPSCTHISVLEGTYLERLVIGRSVEISGVGAVVLDGERAGRVVDVAAGTTVRLAGLTITDGLAPEGGGIRNAGALTLVDVGVESSEARAFRGTGGGIHNTGTLVLRSSRVEGNTVTSTATDLNARFLWGGGIYSSGGDVSLLEGTSVSDNDLSLATGLPGSAMGAGLFLTGGATLLVEDSTIARNTIQADQAYGGGVRGTGASITIGSGARVEDNEVTTPVGAERAAAGGGGLYVSGGTLVVSGAVSDNQARVADFTIMGGAVGGGIGGDSFAGGELRIEGGEVSRNLAAASGPDASASTAQGGGIAGPVALSAGAQVRDNVARAVSGASGAAHAQGGGVYGSLAMTGGARLEGNRAEADNPARADVHARGGGVHSTGPVVITSSVVADNVVLARASGPGTFVEAHGGGVYIEGRGASVLHVVQSTFSGNVADGLRGATGGAIASFKTGGDLECVIEQSTLSANQVLSATRFAQGGAVFIDARSSATATVQIHSSTLSGNEVAAPGGTGGALASETTDMNLSNTILYGNLAATGPDCGPTSGQSIVSGGYNLFGTLTDCAVTGPQVGDRVAVDPGLGPLTDNGGPTHTHLPADGGPAHEGGDPTGCTNHDGVALTEDQRGFPRPVGRCDIGSVELAP